MGAHSASRLALAAFLPFLAVAWEKGDTPPVLIREVPPEYEADLSKAYLMDHVRAEFTIDARGVPFSLSAKTGLPDNVVEAISQWRFRPGRKDGREVAFSVLITLPLRRAISLDVERVYRRRWFPSTKELGDALKAGASLDAQGVGQLLESLDHGGQTMNSSATLLGYWANAQSAGGEDSVKARTNQIAWLVEYAPDSDLLGSPFVLINANAGPLQDLAGYKRIRQSWLHQAELGSENPVIREHAVNFLEVADGEKAEQLLLPLVANHMDEAVAWMGEVYGLATLGVTAVDLKTGLPAQASERLPDTPFSQKARNVLLTTDDPRMVLFGLSTVISGGRSLTKSGHLPTGYADLCGTLLDRARQVQPAISSSCDTALSLAEENRAVTRIRVGGAVQKARLTKQVVPQYPKEAKSSGIQGTVRFNAVIGKEGMIRTLELISGPLALYESARDAVRQWAYSPTRLNGEPVEVATVIDVNYTLSR